MIKLVRAQGFCVTQHAAAMHVGRALAYSGFSCRESVAMYEIGGFFGLELAQRQPRIRAHWR